jgi:hypothetical protein
MVAVIAYFTAQDEVASRRLTRHLRDGGWVVEWTEEGPDGWMLRAAKHAGFDSRQVTRMAAEVLAVTSGAVCECVEIEPAARGSDAYGSGTRAVPMSGGSPSSGQARVTMSGPLRPAPNPPS